MNTHSQIEVKSEENHVGDTVYKVFYKGELVYHWHDNANTDYPEDLVWSRDISGVFFEGVELGKRIQKETG